MSKSKLTRTQSSFLRSSPTIHSLSSINESDLESGEKEEKQRRKPVKLNRIRIKPGLIFVLSSLSFLSLSSFLLFFLFSHFTSENLLLSLIFVAIVLFFVSRNLNRFKIRHKPKPVQWYIGETNQEEEPEPDKLVKEGVRFFTNGDFYEGEFYRGKCNGSGVYYYYINGRYEGDWVNGRYDGYGIECWSKGSKYKGGYKQGLRHGYGVYMFYTGDSYSGEWFNGQSHGFGVQNCGDGSSFVGQFKFGVKHGLGSYHFRNGDKYVGEYFGDKIHGFGVYHFANGHYYEGAWHEGRKQGYGMYVFRNGDVKCGEWDGGHLVKPLSPETGPVYRAVQSAREKAKRCINQRRVDEQAIRAVAAANKAATAARVAAVKAVQNQVDGKVCEIDK